MRVLGIGDGLDLGSMYIDLERHGHDVRAFVADAEQRQTLSGLVVTVPAWESQLDWVRAGGRDGFIVFETATQGALQDALRADGFQVIGGSAYGDRLENDRGFGQGVMRMAGMRVVPTHDFDSFGAAIAFVRGHPRRYVFKPSGGGFASGRTFIAQMDDGADLVAVLELQRRTWPADAAVRLVLMERLEGVEVGIGGYFDGNRFLQPTCLDLEHKRFFPGDLGELTGEMGTLVTYRGGEKLFAETLQRLQEPLRAGGYRGYINVNTIVDDRGVHPLELTCRFGYPGFAILQALQACGWDDLFRWMNDGAPTGDFRFPTRDGFAMGVVLTVPPFPYSAGYDRLSKGMPVIFHGDLNDADRAHLHFSEVALSKEGQLVTSGTVGYIMVVTGVGATAAAARDDAYGRARKVCLVNGRYRTDIGERFITSDGARLRSLGWL
jgi:phosphoribosylamine--glycine ligase